MFWFFRTNHKAKVSQLSIFSLTDGQMHQYIWKRVADEKMNKPFYF